MAFTLETLTTHTGGTLVGGNGSAAISAAVTLETAGPDHITLVDQADKLCSMSLTASNKLLLGGGK